MALRRKQNELRKIQQDNGYTVTLEGGDIDKWKVIIPGPPDSPYEGYQLPLSITLPSDYPHKPPKVYFGAGVIHPNVNTNGYVCLNVIAADWSPLQSIGTVLTSIEVLLSVPGTDSPYNGKLASLYDNDREEYVKVIRKSCEKHLLKSSP